MKKKAKKKATSPLKGVPRDAQRLFIAVRNYVEKRGGKIIVIGGIEVQDWHEGAFKFKVAVSCVGRRPTPDDSTVTTPEKT